MISIYSPPNNQKPTIFHLLEMWVSCSLDYFLLNMGEDICRFPEKI